jgi:hypothetical protein
MYRYSQPKECPQQQKEHATIETYFSPALLTLEAGRVRRNQSANTL